MSESVIGIIFNSGKDHVLLIKRRDVPVWALPGGGVDLGELPEHAVIREVEEETGLKTVIVRKVAEYTPLNRLAKLTHIYECKALDGKLSSGDETYDVKYFPIKNLPQPFFHVHKDWLQDCLEGKSELIRKPIWQVTYGKVLKYFIQHPIQVIRMLLSRLGIPVNI